MLTEDDDRFEPASQVWVRYGELTRFMESARIALDRERALWESTEFVSADTIRLKSPSISGNEYRVRIDQHVAAVSDAETLSGLVLLGSCAAAEELARIALGRSRLPQGGVEAWGAEALALQATTLSAVKGGSAAIVSAYVVRNAVAHGMPRWTPEMVARVSEAAGSPPEVGARVFVARDLEAYRTALRSFMRLTGLTTSPY